MSAVIMNIVVGLITSLISGAAVWGWGRTRVSRRQRERARFFGLSPGDTCRIVAPQAFATWLAGQVALARSRTKTGIWRAVFRWYSAYGGNAATARCHHSARSSPVTSRAIMSHLRGPS